MTTDKILEKVEAELENISNKGLTNSNLDATFKLIDIYKDIKESEYYENQIDNGSYNGMRDRNYGRYYDDSRRMSGERYDHYGPMSRYFMRIEDDLDNYCSSRDRYRNGDSSERIEEGMDMIMESIHKFVECLADYAETSREKEVIRKHIDKMRDI